jgi:uncharacterized protein YndB with AHSA1/START domain
MMGAMSSSTYTVERSATIAAPPEQIYPHLADFHAWTAWSPWEDLDPNQQRTFSGAESGTGAAYAWSGNRKAGKGNMKITETQPPNKIDVDLYFEKPFKSSNTFAFTLTPINENATKVTWTMVGPKTPMTKIMGVFTSMDKMVGPDFERGLARLKTLLEAPPAR